MASSKQRLPPAEPGRKLRQIRESLQLKFRDVEQASRRIATRHNDTRFHIGLSRLADIESKATVPSIFRLYSLSAIYRVDFRTLLGWYGVDLNCQILDAASTPLDQSWVLNVDAAEEVSLPFAEILADRAEPAQNLCLGRPIRNWGSIPASLLASLDWARYRYAFVGMDDLFMHPILRPGSFVQVDETLNRVTNAGWSTEWERPVYLVETRTGYRFAWCSVRGTELLLQPHPTSSRSPEVFRHPAEAEVVGQVVGVAMRLDPEKRRRTRFVTNPE